MAALRLAIMYDQGDGVALNKRDAFHWYMSAAQSGEPAAENEVGSFYEDGAVIQQDWAEAAKWYQLSVQSGWGLGELNLGRAYEYGIGVPLDLQAALDWYSRAAAQGVGQASFFANYIRDNHGMDGSYLSDEEQTIYNTEIPGLPTLGHMVPPATGRVFRNKAERFSYIRNGIARILWAEYEACMRPHTFDTSNPVRTCIQPSVPRPQ
jgi:TPR repeat protein